MNPIKEAAATPDAPQTMTARKTDTTAKSEYKTTHGYTLDGKTFAAGDKQMLTTAAAAKLVGFVKKA